MLPALAFVAIAVVAAFFAVAIPSPARAAYSDAEMNAVQTADEGRIRELRNQEITQLKIALGRRLEGHRRADLYLRLAEIYVEAYRMEFLLEGRVHEKRIEAGKKAFTIDRAHSKPYLTWGIKACNEILRLNLPYPKLDQAYFFLAYYHDELGDAARARESYQTLVEKFPRSPFAREAHKALGDDAFDSARFREAKDSYEAALAGRKGDDGTAARVQHRLAWTYYRLRRYDDAVETMKAAVAGAGRSGERLVSLKEEALRDMAVFLTETGKVDDAIRYFQSVAGDAGYYPKVLERLGRQYERNVEPAKAIQVYESLLKTKPDDDVAFRVRAKLVDLELRRGRHAEALKRLRAGGFPESVLKGGGDDETKTVAQNLRAMTRRTATEAHEAWRNRAARPRLSIAEQFYDAYLDVFLAVHDPRGETAEIRMYLADVKRELGKAKEASALYRKVVDSGDKRYAKEAGALWSASLADAIKKAGAAKPSGEPSALEKEFVEAADHLGEALAGTPEGREAALKAAQLLAGYKPSREDALKRAAKLVSAYPKSQQALTAARLQVQLLSEQAAADGQKEGGARESAERLRDVLKELLGNAALLAYDAQAGKGELQAMLRNQEARLQVGMIAAQEKDKDYSGAARGYEEYAASSKTREHAEKAYASAVSAYLKGDRIEDAERVIDAWSKRYAGKRGSRPDGSKPVHESLRLLATAALIQGQFARSAQLFERLAGEARDGAALLTAARLHEGAGDSVKARDAWSRFLRTFKGSPERWETTLRLARSHEAELEDAAAIAAYKACQGGPQPFAAECGTRLGDLYMREPDAPKARAAYKKAARGTDSPFVAYARYRLGELMEKEARFRPLQPPEPQLRKALNERMAFFEPLTKAYLEAVEAGGPWGVAALDRLASWAWAFADDLDAIVLGPSDAALAKSLAAVVGPLRKKALETWSSAYRKAEAAEILSPAIGGIADRLADAKLKDPVRAQGFRGKLRLAGLPADGGSEGRSSALEKTRARLGADPGAAPAWVDYGNLLWGEGKPLLARVAYERALGLDPKSFAAMNNRAVVLASGDGQEDWRAAAEAASLFADALRLDGKLTAARLNRAAMLSYYRLFGRALPLWDQAAAKAQSADAWDGLAIAALAEGQARKAESAFDSADALGASPRRFARAFHDASRRSGAKCLARLDELDEAQVAGFEKEAAERLRRFCAPPAAKGKGSDE